LSERSAPAASLTIDASGATVRPTFGNERRLVFAGGVLLRVADRIAPSHALLRGEGGIYHLSDGLRTHRAISPAALWALWTSLAAGLGGVLYLLLAAPILARKSTRSPFQPGAIGPLLILAGGGLLSLQSFERLGDLTPASALLFAGSLALPIGAAVQAAMALKRPSPSRWLDIAAGLAVVQWSAVLAGFGLLPLILWT
jgi:hypothetical protein